MVGNSLVRHGEPLPKSPTTEIRLSEEPKLTIAIEIPLDGNDTESGPPAHQYEPIVSPAHFPVSEATVSVAIDPREDGRDLPRRSPMDDRL